MNLRSESQKNQNKKNKKSPARNRQSLNIEKIVNRNLKLEQTLLSGIKLMASMPDNIKQRIAEAYYYEFIYVRAEEMPTKELQDKWTKIIGKITREPPVNVKDVLKRMRKNTCRSIVRDICDVYDGYVNFDWKHQKI